MLPTALQLCLTGVTGWDRRMGHSVAGWGTLVLLFLDFVSTDLNRYG